MINFESLLKKNTGYVFIIVETACFTLVSVPLSAESEYTDCKPCKGIIRPKKRGDLILTANCIWL